MLQTRIDVNSALGCTVVLGVHCSDTPPADTLLYAVVPQADEHGHSTFLLAFLSFFVRTGHIIRHCGTFRVYSRRHTDPNEAGRHRS